MKPIDFFAGKRIDKTIPVPLYYQLKEILLDYIKLQEHNQTIPLEVELCKQFDISRPTVRQAINELVLDGHLERIKGKGTFITKSKIRQDYLLVIESFNDEMHQKGLPHTTKVLEFKQQPVNENIRERLALGPDAAVIKLTRLRSISDEPVLFVKTYLPEKLFPGILEQNLEEKSLYSVVETVYRYKIAKSSRTLEAIKADEVLAKNLIIGKAEPVLFIETVSCLENGMPFEFTLAYYRGDRNKFSFELTNKR